jgi:hypothetical protein
MWTEGQDWKKWTYDTDENRIHSGLQDAKSKEPRN